MNHMQPPIVRKVEYRTVLPTGLVLSPFFLCLVHPPGKGGGGGKSL